MAELQFLGDVIGSLRYLGLCWLCRVQFMSVHERVAVIGGDRVICEACAEKYGRKIAECEAEFGT